MSCSLKLESDLEKIIHKILCDCYSTSYDGCICCWHVLYAIVILPVCGAEERRSWCCKLINLDVLHFRRTYFVLKQIFKRVLKLVCCVCQMSKTSPTLVICFVMIFYRYLLILILTFHLSLSICCVWKMLTVQDLCVWCGYCQQYKRFFYYQ